MAGSQLSVITHCHNDKLIHGSFVIHNNTTAVPPILLDPVTPQGISPLLQMLVMRLLVVLKTYDFKSDGKDVGKDFDWLCITNL